MYQVSERLDRVISGSGRTFYAKVNGVQEKIKKIKITSMSVPDNYIYIGSAIASKVEASMYTKSSEFAEGLEITLEIGAYVDDVIEWVPMGVFTISKSQKDRNLLTFTAYDKIQSKLGTIYSSKVTYPAESREFLKDISDQTGVNFDTGSLEENFVIDKITSIDDQSGEKVLKNPFDGFTMQQVVGYIAQLHGKFAVCDRSGNVTFRWYKKVDIPSDSNQILDQDVFPIRDQTGSALYDSKIDYGDEGKIQDSIGNFLLDQGGFFIYDTLKYYASAQTYIVKTNRYFDDLVKAPTEFKIEGIGCNTESSYFESGGIANIVMDNPAMTQERLDNLFNLVKGFSFYPASFSFMGDPRLDVGDIIVVIDATGNPINVPVMNHTLTYDGGLLSSVASYGERENAAEGPTAIAVQQMRNDILTLQEITAQKATFNQLLAVDAKITNLQASVITADTANILYARLDKTNIELGWITTAMIGNAQITDAKIDSLTASKITSGTIDASDINVINLNAANITVGKINGKQLSDDINSSITDSANKANSALSTANSSIQTVRVEYYSSLSETELIGGAWSETSPDWVEGRYIWSRNKTTTKAGNVTYSKAACITGNTGAQGIQGIQGEKGDQGIPGTNGKTTYFHIKYSSVSKPTSASQMTETPSTYIGTYVDYTETDSTDPNKYTWSRFQGIQGAKGDQGIPGTNGANGQTSYLHIAYANSADGKTGFDVSNGVGKLYIGQYTDFIQADSTDPTKYTWSKIKGDTGAQGASIVTLNTGYSYSQSDIDAYSKAGYIGTWNVNNASNVRANDVVMLSVYNTTKKGQSYIIAKVTAVNVTANQVTCTSAGLVDKGNTGAQGIQGIGVKSIKSQYYLSNSSTAQSGGNWGDKQPAWKSGYYIWTRSYIVWSNNTSTTTDPVLAEALNTANSVANTALNTANGKNTAFYQSSQPSTVGRKQNDIWYDTGNGNAMYYFNGSTWVKKVFGNDALDNLSASKITTGTLDAAKVTLINLDAGSITTGTITGLDALFNKSFRVNSPVSDNLNFVINASSSGFDVGLLNKSSNVSRYEALIAFDTNNTMRVETDGSLRVTGKSHLSLVSNENIVMYPGYIDKVGDVYINDGTTNNIVLHAGNAKAASSFENGVEIGSIELGNSRTALKVPLASNTQSGLITATEKAKINTDYLPLTGGTLKSSNVDVLGLNCTSGTMSTLRFYGNGARLGSIGFNGQNSKAYRWNASGTSYKLLDEDDLKDSGWVNITLASGLSAISYIGARVRKIGNVVNIIMGVTGATAAFQTLGTLASSYRPQREVSFAARYYNSPNAGISIGTDGSIKLLATSSGGTTYASAGAISFTVTYFV